MITGSGEETCTLMMDAAIRIVAVNGFEGFTTKKWAIEAGVAEGSLYYHFGSKYDLLDRSFLYIVGEVVALYERLDIKNLDQKETAEILGELWKLVYHYLLDHPDKTQYCYRFRTSARYTLEIQREQYEFFIAFLEQIKRIVGHDDFLEGIEWPVLWCYIVDTTISMAFRTIVGGLDQTEENENQMLKLLLSGILKR